MTSLAHAGRAAMMLGMTVAFWSAFTVTVTLLAFTVWSGRTGRRRHHFVLAPVTVVSLTVTIVLAERLAGARSFPPDEMRIHLWFAKTAALLVLPVIVTGLGLARRPTWRRLHLACVGLFVLATLIATGTGIWVFSLSTPN